MPPAALPDIDRRYVYRRSDAETYHLPAYPTLAAWEERAAYLRKHILCVLGLWPLPERTPLTARVYDRMIYDGYSVEKVAFESHPGFLCTGNLYRPLAQHGRVPAVLNPHGHWEHGRLEHSARGSIPARCATMARLGLVALSIDMVGYSDSLQVPRHRFASRLGALWGLTPMALQTWNAIRAVDFLCSLDDVDPQRLACTGASGGGTQTFVAAAVDPRLKVLAPVNMISAHFQGGCVCENNPGLRTVTNNLEIAALAAPRPMLMVSATGDWTANTPRVEYPEIRAIYRLYGAEDRLAWAQVNAEHNYNAESRGHVYRWLARWLLNRALEGDPERPLGEDDLSRWRLYPRGIVDLPPDLPRGAALQALLRLGAHPDGTPLAASAEERDRDLQITRTRLAHILSCGSVASEQVLAVMGDPAACDGGSCFPMVLGRRGHAERIRALWCEPVSPVGGPPVLVAHGAGLAGLTDAYGDPGALLAALLEAGRAVLAIEPLYTGAVPSNALPSEARDWFEQSFNPPLMGWRAQDILTALAYLRGLDQGDPSMIGLGAAGPWAVLAGALAGPLSCLYAEVAAPDLVGADFAPALERYGGLAAATLAILAPRLGLHAPSLDLVGLRQRRARSGYPPATLVDRPPYPDALAAWVAGDAAIG